MLPPYNDWVKTLAADCDTSGFALPPRLLDIAYRQIVVEGEVAFGINTDTAAIRNKIINGLRRSDDMTALVRGFTSIPKSSRCNGRYTTAACVSVKNMTFTRMPTAICLRPPTNPSAWRKPCQPSK